jgi:hypothetical protein
MMEAEGDIGLFMSTPESSPTQETSLLAFSLEKRVFTTPSGVDEFAARQEPVSYFMS